MKRLSILLLFCGLIGGSFTTASAAILWSADHETGNLNQWNGASHGYDGCWANGGATCAISTRYKRSGSYSARMTTRNGGTTSSGARLAKTQTDSPPPLWTEAYYSAWYYTPQVVTVPVWNIIFEWKQHGTVFGSDPTYSINIYNPSAGRMALRLYKYIGYEGNYNTRGVGWAASSAMNVPTNRWWHLECYYKWARTLTGRLTCWQDGQLLWDLVNYQTEYNYGFPSDRRPYQWMPANYADNTSPGTHTIYLDDAVISTTPVWAPP